MSCMPWRMLAFISRENVILILTAAWILIIRGHIKELATECILVLKFVTPN